MVFKSIFAILFFMSLPVFAAQTADLQTDSFSKILKKIFLKKECEEYLTFTDSVSTDEHKISLAAFLKFLEEYPHSKIEYISRGGNGMVLKVAVPQENSKRVKIFAVKFFWGDESFYVDTAETVVHMGKTQTSPELVARTFEILNDGTSGYLQIEYIQGQNLYKYLKKHHLEPLQFEIKYFLISQMAYAVDALHAQNMVHRDIKISNFIVEQVGDKPVGVHLVDLDDMLEHGSIPKLKIPFGTPDYIDPNLKGKGDVLSTENDMYSLMVSFRALLLAKYIKKISLGDDQIAPLKKYIEKSPFSYDSEIPEQLSIIAFHRFKNTTDLIEALDKAKKYKQNKDKFCQWFYEKHLKQLSNYDWAIYVEKSKELTEAVKSKQIAQERSFLNQLKRDLFPGFLK